MFYLTHEVSEKLRYASPRTFLVACKSADSSLIRKILKTRVAGKVGKNILWNKSQVDQILEHGVIQPVEAEVSNIAPVETPVEVVIEQPKLVEAEEVKPIEA